MFVEGGGGVEGGFWKILEGWSGFMRGLWGFMLAL